MIRPPGYVTNSDHPCASEIAIPRDANALCERVMEALPRDVIIYHRGMLARDRDRNATRMPEHQRIELDAVANYAWRLAEAGWAHLLQQREASDCFLYLLVIRQRPHQRRASLPKPPAVRRPLTMLSPQLAEAA